MSYHVSQEVIEWLEKERLAYYKRKTKAYIWLIPYGIVAVIIAAILVPELARSSVKMAGYLVLGLIALGGLIYKWIVGSLDRVKAQFQKHYIDAVVKNKIPDMQYQAKGFVNQQHVLNSNLLGNKFSTYNGEDLINGTIGKTKIMMSDLVITRKEGRETKTIFDGVFCIAEFNKQLSGTTYVMPDGFFQNKKFQGLPRQKMEDPRFEKYYDAFSADPVESRYVLTTSLMERIIALREKFGKQIYFGFTGDHVYMAINGFRLFELDMTKPIHDQSTFQRLEEEIDLTVGIVEDLNLNLRIWTKS